MASFLDEAANKYVLFPIRFNSIWQMYKKAVSAFWTAEEIDFSKDYNDWVKLNENEQFFIKNILAFFAASDGIVNENLAVRFMQDVAAQEAKCFYGFQIAMENIHCVSGYTQIVTSKGTYPIKNFEGKVTEVWNGEQFSSVMVFKTKENTDVYNVTLSNGKDIVCTPNHKWLIGKDAERVHTIDLKKNDIITPFNLPIVDCENNALFNNCQKHGELAGKKFDVNYKSHDFNCRYQYYVPFNYSVKTKVEWLSGLMLNSEWDYECGQYVIKHTVRLFLNDLQLLFDSLNVKSVIKECNIYITKSESEKLKKLGVVNMVEPHKNTFVFTNDKIFIESVQLMPYKADVYCFEEPLKSCGTFNGIVTGQSEVYSLMLDTYIKDSEDRSHLLNAINTIPTIAKKAEWAIKWITDKETSFPTRLLAFACVEGIFFSGAFCSIFWLKERGVMPGLTLSNEFISRDESLHTEFAVLLYSQLPKEQKLSADNIYDIIREAVEIENEFINESIPCNLLGMNQLLMTQYIQFVADRLIVQLGYEPIYNVNNPFHFMDRISLTNKTNFFEHTRQSEYAIARVGNTKEDNSFSLDAEF